MLTHEQYKALLKFKNRKKCDESWSPTDNTLRKLNVISPDTYENFSVDYDIFTAHTMAHPTSYIINDYGKAAIEEYEEFHKSEFYERFLGWLAGIVAVVIGSLILRYLFGI